MKLEKLRLIVDLDIDPQGISRPVLMANLRGLVHTALDNGTFTGDSPATLENHKYRVHVRRSVKKPISAESKAIIANYDGGLCPDSKSEQDKEDAAEQQRRDEKNGLYPDKVDIAN